MMHVLFKYECFKSLWSSNEIVLLNLM